MWGQTEGREPFLGRGFMMKHYTKDGSEVRSFKRATPLMMAVVVVAALLVASSSLVSAGPGGSTLTASALLLPVLDPDVSGRVTLTNDGSVLTVRGTAEGLVGTEFSLLYDILSVATGDLACEPGIDDVTAPGDLTGPEMGTGGQLVWEVSRNGHGRLNGTVDVGLDKVRTISIRRPGGFLQPMV